MKISTGKFKGRNIIVPSDIRPVSLKVRKSCFDILGDEISGRKVLDLFAGSGSLGIEALSRGASGAVFIELKGKCTEAIANNISSLYSEYDFGVYQKDVFTSIKDFWAKKEHFGVIFLDPPYYKGMLIKALQLLEGYDILAPSGYVVGFCYEKDPFLEAAKKFSLILNRKYGQNRLLIYRKDEKSDLSRDI